MRPDIRRSSKGGKYLTKAFERALLTDEIWHLEYFANIADGSERILEINSEALAKGVTDNLGVNILSLLEVLPLQES